MARGLAFCCPRGKPGLSSACHCRLALRPGTTNIWAENQVRETEARKTSVISPKSQQFKVKKITKQMSDLELDSTTDVEVVTDAEEELMKECEELWKGLEDCQKKLLLFGTETLTDSNAQLSVSLMQMKCLTAELSQLQKETPTVVPLNEDMLVTLGKEEFQKLRHDLEMVLSCIQSKNAKLKEDLQRQQQWLDEQEQIKETLNVVYSELKNQVATFPESRVFNELKTKILNIKKYKKRLLTALGEFLEDHFPLPDESAKKKRNVKESTAQLITLHEILETLINRLFDAPHNPYVKITDSFWPPYIELLLRNGIALRHPEDPTQIRLEAFHQ